MRRVQIGMLRTAHVHPCNSGRIVSVVKRQKFCHPLTAVEVVRSCLHPCIVGVARVVHVTGVYNLATCKELFGELIESLSSFFVLDVSRLLGKFTTNRRRDVFSRINNASWQRPFASVLPLDGDNLKLRRLVRIEARHNWVGGEIRPPHAKQPTPTHASTASWVERMTAGVEADNSFEGGTSAPIELVHVDWVGPALWFDGPVIVEHHLRSVLNRHVLLPNNRPQGAIVRNAETLGVQRMLPTCSPMKLSLILHGMDLAVREIKLSRKITGALLLLSEQALLRSKQGLQCLFVFVAAR
mmetsp:Transcript_46488/g.108062  ORF Transcript_46488/g.108062 Transcript_46488/m.108062 type:complete len:298 (+) Transcript_46488:255-1148(+)